MNQPDTAATELSEIERACERYLHQVRTVTPVDALTVVLLDPGDDTGKVIFSRRTTSQTDSTDSPRPMFTPPELEQQPVLNITMYGHEGPIGGVLLHTLDTEGFSQLHYRLARDLSYQLAMRLENAQLHQRLQATCQEVGLLDEVTRIINSSLDLKEVFDLLSAAVRKVVELDALLLSWLDPDDYDIHTLQSGEEPYVTASFQVAIPVTYGANVIASLKVYRVERPFNARERELLSLVSNQIAPSVESTRYHYSIAHQSLHSQAKGSDAPSNEPEPHESTDERTDSPIDLAHALCTPLTAIKGYASSLLQSGVDWPPEVQREFLGTIDQAADRLGEVIRESVLSGLVESAPMKCQ